MNTYSLFEGSCVKKKNKAAVIGIRMHVFCCVFFHIDHERVRATQRFRTFERSKKGEKQENSNQIESKRNGTNRYHTMQNYHQ